METYGKFLKSLREIRGLSQSDVAVAAGVSEATIKKSEYGTHVPKRSTAARILRALDQSLQVAPEDRANYLRLSGFEVFGQAFRDAQAKGLVPRDVIEHEPANDADSNAADDLLRATQQHGARRIMRLINAALSLSIPAARDVSSNEAPVAGEEIEHEEVDVISPPVQRKGYVEQVITTYSRGKSAKPAPRVNKKRGTA